MNYFSSSYIHTNIAKLATQYVGRYLDGIEPDKFAVAWKSGVLKLSDIHIKKDIVESLNLPFYVHKGSIGHVTITFPYSNILSLTLTSSHKPLVIELIDVFIILSPKLESEWDIDTLKERFTSNRERLLDNCDVSLLAEQAKKQLVNSNNNVNKLDQKAGWMAKLATRILSDIRINIRSIHIRLENTKACFGLGITLKELQIHTPNVTEWNQFKEYLKTKNPSIDLELEPKNDNNILLLAEQKKILKIYDVSVYHTNFSLFISHKEIFDDTKKFNNYMRSLFTSKLQINYVLKPFTGILGTDIQTIQINNKTERGVNKLYVNLQSLDVCLSKNLVHTIRNLGNLIEAYHTQVRNVEDQYEYYQPYRPDIPIHANAKIWWRYSVGCILRRLNRGSIVQHVSRWSWGEHLQAARVAIWKHDFRVLLIKQLLYCKNSDTRWTPKMQMEYNHLLKYLPKTVLLEVYVDTKQAYLDDEYDRINDTNYDPKKSRWKSLIENYLLESEIKTEIDDAQEQVTFYDIEDDNLKQSRKSFADVFQDVEDSNDILSRGEEFQDKEDFSNSSSNIIIDKLLAADIYTVRIIFEFELLQVSFEITDNIKILNCIENLHLAGSYDESTSLKLTLQDWSMIYDDLTCDISYKFLMRTASLEKTYFHLDFCTKDTSTLLPKLKIEVQQITFTLLPVVVTSCLNLINSLKFSSSNDENETAFITQSLVKFEKISQAEQMEMYKNIILDLRVAAPTIIILSSSNSNIKNLLSKKTPRIVINLGLFTVETLESVIPLPETPEDQPHISYIYTNNKILSIILQEVNIKYQSIETSLTMLEDFGVSIELSLLWFYIKEMLKVFAKVQNFEQQTDSKKLNLLNNISINGKVSPLNIYLTQEAYNMCITEIEALHSLINDTEEAPILFIVQSVKESPIDSNNNDLLFPLKLRVSKPLTEDISVSKSNSKQLRSISKKSSSLSENNHSNSSNLSIVDSDNYSTLETLKCFLDLPQFSLKIEAPLNDNLYILETKAVDSELNVQIKENFKKIVFTLGDLVVNRLDVQDLTNPCRILINTQEVNKYTVLCFPFEHSNVFNNTSISSPKPFESQFISITYISDNSTSHTPPFEISIKVTRFLHINFQPLVISSLILFWRTPRSERRLEKTHSVTLENKMSSSIVYDSTEQLDFTRQNDTVKTLINISVVGVSITCVESSTNCTFGIIKFDSMEYKMKFLTYGIDIITTLSNFRFIDSSAPDGVYRQLFGILDNRDYILSINCQTTNELAPYYEGANVKLNVDIQSVEIVCYLSKLLRIFKWIIGDFLNTIIKPDEYIYSTFSTKSSSRSATSIKPSIDIKTSNSNTISNQKSSTVSNASLPKDGNALSEGSRKLLAWLIGVLQCKCKLNAAMMNCINILQDIIMGDKKSNNLFIPYINSNKFRVYISQPIIIIPVSIKNTEHITLSLKEICIENEKSLNYVYGIVEKYTFHLMYVTIIEKVNNATLLNNVNISIQYISTTLPDQSEFPPLWMKFQFSDVPWYLTPTRVNLLWKIIYTNILGNNNDTISILDSVVTELSQQNSTQIPLETIIKSEPDCKKNNPSSIFEFNMPGLFVFLSDSKPRYSTICFHADMLNCNIKKFADTGLLKISVTVNAARLYNCTESNLLNIVLSDSQQSLEEVGKHELQRLTGLIRNKQKVPKDVESFIESNSIYPLASNNFDNYTKEMKPSKEIIFVYKHHVSESFMNIEIYNPRIVIDKSFIELVIKYSKTFDSQVDASMEINVRQSPNFCVKQNSDIIKSESSKIYIVKLKNASLIFPDEGSITNKNILVLRGSFQYTQSKSDFVKTTTICVESAEIFRTDITTLSALENYENKELNEYTENPDLTQNYDCTFNYEKYIEQYIQQNPKQVLLRDYINSFINKLPKKLFLFTSAIIPGKVCSKKSSRVSAAMNNNYQRYKNKKLDNNYKLKNTIHCLLHHNTDTTWSDFIRLLCPNVECTIDITESYDRSKQPTSSNYILLDNIPIELKNELKLNPKISSNNLKNKKPRNKNILTNCNGSGVSNIKDVQNITISIHPINFEISYQDIIFITKIFKSFSHLNKSKVQNKDENYSIAIQRHLSCDFSEIKILIVNDSMEYLSAPFLQFKIETGAFVMCQWSDEFLISTFTATYSLFVFNQKAVAFEPFLEPFRATVKYIQSSSKAKSSSNYWFLIGSQKFILNINISTNLISTCIQNYKYFTSDYLNNSEIKLNQKGVFQFTPYKLKNLTGVNLYIQNSSANELSTVSSTNAYQGPSTDILNNSKTLLPGECFHKLTKFWTSESKNTTPKINLHIFEKRNEVIYFCSTSLSLQIPEKCLVQVNSKLDSDPTIEKLNPSYVICRLEVVDSQKQLSLESQTMIHNQLGPNISVDLKFTNDFSTESIPPYSKSGINITGFKSAILHLKPKIDNKEDVLNWSVESIDLELIWKRVLIYIEAAKIAEQVKPEIPHNNPNFYANYLPKFLPNILLKCLPADRKTELTIEDVFYVVIEISWEIIKYRNYECVQLNLIIKPPYTFQNYLSINNIAFHLDVPYTKKSENTKLTFLRTTVEINKFDDIVRIYSLPLNYAAFIILSSIDKIWGKKKKIFLWVNNDNSILSEDIDNSNWLQNWITVGTKLCKNKRYINNKIINIKSYNSDNLPFIINLIIQNNMYQSVSCILYCPIWLHTYINLDNIQFQYDPETVTKNNTNILSTKPFMKNTAPENILQLINTYIPIYTSIRQFRLAIKNDKGSPWISVNENSKVFTIKLNEKYYEIIYTCKESIIDIPYNIKAIVIAPRYILINNTSTQLYYQQNNTSAYIKIIDILPLYWLDISQQPLKFMLYENTTDKSNGTINPLLLENYFSYLMLNDTEKKTYKIIRINKIINSYTNSILLFMNEEDIHRQHGSIFIQNNTTMNFSVSQLNGLTKIMLKNNSIIQFGWYSNTVPLIIRFNCVEKQNVYTVPLSALESSKYIRVNQLYILNLQNNENNIYIYISNILEDIFSPTNKQKTLTSSHEQYIINDEHISSSYTHINSLDIFNINKLLLKNNINASYVIILPVINISLIGDLQQTMPQTNNISINKSYFLQKELLAICITDFKLRLLYTTNIRLFTAIIANLQIDNPEPYAYYPVIFQKLNESISTSQKEYENKQLTQDVDLFIDTATHPFLDIMIINNITNKCINHIIFTRFIILPLVCKLDYTFVNNILYIYKKYCIGKLFSRNNDSHIDEETTDILFNPYKTITSCHIKKFYDQNTELIPQQIQPKFVLNIDKLIIHPVLVNFSFSVRSRDQTSAIQNQSFFFKFLLSIGSIELAAMYLKTFKLTNKIADMFDLINICKTVYLSQIIQQGYAFTNVDLLGNPITTFSHIGTGLVDFVTEPVRSLRAENSEALSVVKGIGKGAKSLWNNTVFGTFNAVSKVSGAAAQGLSIFSLDNDFSKEQQQGIRRRPKDASEGLFMGTEAFSKSLIGGLKGLVTEPTKGAEEKGFEGLIQGVGKGVVGALVKPVAGVLEMTALATGGIQQAAGESAGLFREVKNRFRYPRCFYTADRIMKQYNFQDAKLIDTLIDTQNFDVYANNIEAIFHDVNHSVLITTDYLLRIRNKPPPPLIDFQCELWKISSVKVSQNTTNKDQKMQSTVVIIQYYLFSPTYQLRKVIKTSSKELAIKLANLIEEKRLN